MRVFLCICAASFVASSAGCMSSQGYMMNHAGQTFYQRGNYAQAAMEFQRAVAADPYNADYAANLAASLKKQGNLQAAEQTWRQALQLNPSHQPSYHGLAQMLVETERPNEAATLLSMWGTSQPYSAEPQIEMAWLNRELGNASGAAQNLQQALQVSPNHPKALAALGQYYQDTGQLAQAVSSYQQSLRSDWHQPEIQSRLATLRGFESPQQDARTQLAQSFNSVPNMTMQFPPTPQIAQARGRRFPPVPQFARAQNQFQASPYGGLAGQLAQASPYGTQAAAIPQFAQTQQPHTGHQHGALHPQIAAIPPVPQPTFTANMPVANGHQFVQQPPVAQTLPPQPAVQDYPVSGFNSAVVSPDPFANQFINQPYAGAPTVQPGVSTGSAPFAYTPPVQPSVGNGAQVFAPPVGAVPVTNADPAHVPQVSSVPVLAPF